LLQIYSLAPSVLDAKGAFAPVLKMAMDVLLAELGDFEVRIITSFNASLLHVPYIGEQTAVQSKGR
jgi:hypothetical protein